MGETLKKYFGKRYQEYLYDRQEIADKLADYIMRQDEAITADGFYNSLVFRLEKDEVAQKLYIQIIQRQLRLLEIQGYLIKKGKIKKCFIYIKTELDTPPLINQ